VSQALYRRYRPESFADVIGQRHVTEPLQQALTNKRIHHAYLFSGPRGCGKTTSARILARCLNCEQGPTPTPCGTCQSCQDLARDGSGSLDVIEIDAASHGGVDDARDLRERAFYAPASSRYKIYIIDEAHMVSREGFNALLKLVEEPPDHVKFVFATTEPDKVIATIRSRTHHYPFRLVPPGELQAHLARICELESVTVGKGVLPLVVRAGRGSVRDSMSVLDQLVAGAGKDGVTYPLATALLGYTDATLLDDTIEAFAAGDGAAVFSIVDRVVEAGHDPKRFADDLLERLRDLVIIDAVPDTAATILSEHPADELERMRQQAAHFGAAQLSRAADIVNTGLTEMRGATAPRLHLELICARVLLPAADNAERGLGARLDRLERRMAISGTTSEQPVQAAAAPERRAERLPEPALPVQDTPPASLPGQSVEPMAAELEPTAPTAPTEPTTSAAVDPRPSLLTPPAVAVGAAAGGELDLTAIRRMWPDVMAAVSAMKKTTWSLLKNASVIDLDAGRLTLGFSTPGLRDAFVGRSDHQDYVREALIQVLGVDWKVEAIVDPSVAQTTSLAPDAPDEPAGRREGAARPSQRTPQATAGDDSAPSVDDPDAEDAGLTSHDLLARELGAKVIGEYDNG
jgi:DNA polymerase III subunit gamma/tau